MSKIFKKNQLDLVIENTIKEAGLTLKSKVKDIVEVSTKELAESVTKSTINESLTNDMETFNKLINYRK
jgi:hypothetical protein